MSDFTMSAGHSRLEEEYFYKKDRELIEKIKKEKAEAETQKEKALHLGHCPSCGSQTESIVLADGKNSKVDYCHSCGSVTMKLNDLLHLDRHTIKSLKTLEDKEAV